MSPVPVAFVRRVLDGGEAGETVSYLCPRCQQREHVLPAEHGERRWSVRLADGPVEVPALCTLSPGRRSAKVRLTLDWRRAERVRAGRR